MPVAAKDIKMFGACPEKELIIIVGRHDSAKWNPEDPEDVEAYWRGLNDPELSEKGIESARNTALSLSPIVAGEKVLWLSSPMKRAKQTAEIWARENERVMVCDYLAPADFGEIPVASILAWMVHQNDNLVYQGWIYTTGFWRTWTNAKVMQVMLCSGMVHKTNNVNIIGAVGHCEQAAMLLTAIASFPPENFAKPKFQIKRGEFKIIRITPRGEIKFD